MAGHRQARFPTEPPSTVGARCTASIFDSGRRKWGARRCRRCAQLALPDGCPTGVETLRPTGPLGDVQSPRRTHDLTEKLSSPGRMAGYVFDDLTSCLAAMFSLLGIASKTPGDYNSASSTVAGMWIRATMTHWTPRVVAMAAAGGSRRGDMSGNRQRTDHALMGRRGCHGAECL